MTYSGLANEGFYECYCHDDGRTGTICKITPHYWANDGNGASNSSIVDMWNNNIDTRPASSNYLIDDRGSILCAVEEENRAWTSSNFENDSIALTIEVSTLSNNTGEITYDAWASLVKLCTDICHRYNFTLNYTGESDGSLTFHYMFSATDCPGQYIIDHAYDLVENVNNNLATGNFEHVEPVGNSSASDGGGGNITGVVNDSPTAYAVGINNKILFEQDYITPYVVCINENTPELDYQKLKEKDVVGVLIDTGSYFNELHEVNYPVRNQNLDAQVQAAKLAYVPFGFIVNVKAQSIEEAYAEFADMKLIVRRYPPQLGVWLNLDLGDDIDVNTEIINQYYRVLYDYGFYDQMGLYGDREHIDKIKWDENYMRFYWVMNRHLSSLDKVHQLPKPEFFMYEGTQDEEALIEPDFAAAARLKTTGGSSSSSSGSSGDFDFSGEEVAEIIWNAALSQGCTQEAAAALIGNSYQESGINPASDSGVAKGLFQCESGYWGELYSIADEMGTDWTDPRVQITLLFRSAPAQFDTYTGLSPHYYSTGEWCWWPEPMTFDEWCHLTDVALATEIFERVWERASIPMMENRINAAYEYYDKFKK